MNSDVEKRQQQEYEFVMEGITTRMQIAMEKISESNKLLRSTVKYVCLVMLAVVFIVIAGFIINNQLWISHVNHVRNSAVCEVVGAGEEVSQFRPGTND